MIQRNLAQSFHRGFAALFVFDLVAKALTAATVVALIRGLSVSMYAYVTVLLTLAQVTASAAGGGILTRYLREESERASRDPAGSPEERFIQAWLKATLIIAGFGIVALPIVELLGVGSDLEEAIGLVAMGTVFAIGANATELAIARQQARRRFSEAGALNVIRACALLVSALVVGFADNVLVVGGWLVSSMVIVGIASTAGILRKALNAGTERRLDFSREEIWLSFFSFAAAGFAYIDVLVASALLNDYQVSTLGAALRYWAIVVSAMPALGAVWRVRMAQVDIVGSHAGQRSMLVSWIRRTSIPATVLTSATFLLAPVAIPAIDGGKYPGSVDVFKSFL